jgi:hypothetical protein
MDDYYYVLSLFIYQQTLIFNNNECIQCFSLSLVVIDGKAICIAECQTLLNTSGTHDKGHLCCASKTAHGKEVQVLET